MALEPDRSAFGQSPDSPGMRARRCRVLPPTVVFHPHGRRRHIKLKESRVRALEEVAMPWIFLPRAKQVVPASSRILHALSKNRVTAEDQRRSAGLSLYSGECPSPRSAGHEIPSFTRVA